jgi:hypothetical protein
MKTRETYKMRPTDRAYRLMWWGIGALWIVAFWANWDW